MDRVGHNASIAQGYMSFDGPGDVPVTDLPIIGVDAVTYALETANRDMRLLVAMKPVASLVPERDPDGCDLTVLPGTSVHHLMAPGELPPCFRDVMTSLLCHLKRMRKPRTVMKYVLPFLTAYDVVSPLAEGVIVARPLTGTGAGQEEWDSSFTLRGSGPGRCLVAVRADTPGALEESSRLQSVVAGGDPEKWRVLKDTLFLQQKLHTRGGGLSLRPEHDGAWRRLHADPVVIPPGVLGPAGRLQRFTPEALRLIGVAAQAFLQRVLSSASRLITPGFLLPALYASGEGVVPAPPLMVAHVKLLQLTHRLLRVLRRS